MKKFLEYIKKKLGIKSESADSESEEEIGNFSMNEGKADKVFGFRREIVKGVAVFFVTVLILALIFASSDGEESKKEAASLPVANESEIADVKKPKNTLPNDYETLMAMNKAKEEEMRRQAEENAKNAAKNQTVEPANIVETPPQAVPAIPQGQYKVLPAATQMPVLPEESLTNETVKVDRSPKNENDKYKSAISFALGGEVNQNEDLNNKTSAKAQIQKKPEYHAPDSSTLDAGTVIPVRLLTGINTDVEGQVMAQVLIDVYDTATGTKLLIPQGSKITGSYEKKAVSNGRVPVTFKQLTLPNGGSWSIVENIIAIDGAGYTGIAGKVHRHTGQKISAGAMGSAIAALGSVAAGNVSAKNETYTAGQIAAQGATANLINMTSNLLKESSDMANTVTVEPGYEFNVYVTNNITF